MIWNRFRMFISLAFPFCSAKNCIDRWVNMEELPMIANSINGTRIAGIVPSKVFDQFKWALSTPLRLGKSSQVEQTVI
jgi:hypothetical protein